jgi:hypothetical protein
VLLLEDDWRDNVWRFGRGEETEDLEDLDFGGGEVEFLEEEDEGMAVLVELGSSEWGQPRWRRCQSVVW